MSLLCVYTVIVFSSGYLLHRSGFRFEKTASYLRRATSLAWTIVPSTLAWPDVEHLEISIQPDDFRRLAAQRAEALRTFHLEVGEDDYVPATITHNDRSLEARVRLKGDWIDHFDSHKWSLRIRFRGDDALFGMRRFSIQHPKTRKYIYEWIYHRALRREDVLGLRYDFIDVTQNGVHLGLYALEEHFGQSLLEHNARPEGPIIRFNENLMYRIQLQFRPFREVVQRGSWRRAENSATSTTVDSYLAVDLDSFETARMLGDPQRRATHEKAIHLLEAFRRGEVDTASAFDSRKLATYFALSDLLGSQHSHHWRNLRFYYNPATSRLEPVGFDADAGFAITGLSATIDADFERTAPIGAGTAMFRQSVFSDLEFFEQYVGALERVSESGYLEGLLSELESELRENLEVLRSEFPGLDYSSDMFFRNRTYIRAALDPVKPLHAYYVGSTTDQIELQLGNIQALPVEVLGISYRDSPLLDPAQNIVLPGAQILQPRPVDYRVARFTLPKGFARTVPKSDELKVVYSLLGTSRVREVEVFDWPFQSERSVAEDFLRRPATHGTFDFLVTDEATKEILVKPGRWTLDRDLIIPAGYRCIAAEGTELNLTNAAAILSYSPLDWVGGEGRHILVHSKDGSGQGIVVMNAGKTSVLRHVVFDNLSAPSRNDWSLSGGVTFYESPVEMSHATVTAGRSEDALHIIRAPFEIEKTVFANAASDALDVDFGDGSIVDTNFMHSGNDAIDVSGSFVEMRGIKVNGAGDKGLSVGERSEVKASDVDIQGAEVAVASKDDSIVTLVGTRISEGEIGLAAFCKKPEFGPASLVVHNLESTNVRNLYLIEIESSLSVDGKVMPATETDLRNVLY